MTALQSVVLTLPARLDDRAMATFEGVFSELLDSAATSFQRDDACLLYTSPSPRD